MFMFMICFILFGTLWNLWGTTTTNHVIVCCGMCVCACECMFCRYLLHFKRTRPE